MMIDKFIGLVNTKTVKTLPPNALTVAEQVLITDQGTVQKREGFQKIVSADKITSSYQTLDNRWLFVIDNGVLFRFDGQGFIKLADGLPVAPAHWCEESNNRVFVISGPAYLQIDDGSVVTQLHNLNIQESDSLNDLAFNVETTPSSAKAITFHRNSVVLAVPVQEGLTRIQLSLPGAYHLFSAVEDRFEIPDDIIALESVNRRLLIVGKHSIWTYTSENQLLKLADYGGVPGKCITKLPDSGCFIWTTRGIARFPELENVTEKTVSLPPGFGCATALYEKNGNKYLLIVNDAGGSAYNSL